MATFGKPRRTKVKCRTEYSSGKLFTFDPNVPIVLNRRTDYIPPDAVYVGRPTKWGNPFKLGVHGCRNSVVALYDKWLQTQPELVAAAKRELKGKHLSCWCSPDYCHADILLRIANEP